MKPDYFLRLRALSIKKVQRALVACFLFFSLVGVESAQAQIFQFSRNDSNYAAALSVAFAQESAKDVNADTKISLDESFTPQDFGVSGVGTLPDSPFYFFKDAGRGITSFFTFNPEKKAELRLQYASEKFLEAQALSAKDGVDPAEVTAALDNFGKELEYVQTRVEKAAPSAGNAASVLSEKVMDSVLKYSKSLDNLEKTLPPDAFEKIAETKDKAFAVFGAVGNLVSVEEIPQKLVEVLDQQKGSEFKNFKNAEVLKEMGEKIPDDVKGAVKVAEDNTLLKLQNELEGLDASKKALLQDFVQQIGGNELRHLEIIDALEARPVSQDLRDAIGDAKEETLARTETRLSTLTPEQQKIFSDHLGKGELEDVRVVNELEKNIKPSAFQNFEGIKKAVKDSFVKKFETLDQNAGEKEKILENVTQYHDAKSIAIFDELESLIPLDKKSSFEEIKKRAADEIRKDIERARNEQQKQVILSALAGDQPDELTAIQSFQNGAGKQYQNVFDILAKAQFKALQDRADVITDKDHLAKFESEIKQSQTTSKESVFDWKSIFGSLDDKRKVFESPDLALEKVREAEMAVTDFREVANTLPLDTAYADGKFDYTAQEIGRLLSLAERRVETARTVLEYNDTGRAYNEAVNAEDIARNGMRMAQDYKAGRKKIVPPPPFFAQPITTPNEEENGGGVSSLMGLKLFNEYEFGQYCFYVGGFMKTRMLCVLNDGRVVDVRGKTFPLDIPPEFVPHVKPVTAVPSNDAKCPVIFPPAIDFCPKGKIVYGNDARGCQLPPTCVARTEGTVRTNPANTAMCGGIAGYECLEGYYCQYPDTTTLDAFGKCVPNMSNTCQQYFTGYIFDTALRACRVENTSGCSDPFIFHDLASCERANTSTKPIGGMCPKMPTVDSCPIGQKKVESYKSPECGIYYACELEIRPMTGTFPYTFSTGYIVKDYTSAKEYCLQFPPGSGAGIAGECEAKFGITYGTFPKPEGSKWVRHFWRFIDGMTSESMILNRTDAEYNTYISGIEAQCAKIPMNKFAWRPSAGNDAADNWQNFGIPDCSGTATTAAVCGNHVCDMGETTNSCSQDCGGTGIGGYVDCAVNKTVNACTGYSQCRWDATNSSCLANAGSMGGGCRTYVSQSTCQAAYCTWYPNHYDGTHCDDGAHGGSGTWTSTSTPLSDAPGAPTGLTATRVTGAVKLAWFSSSPNVLKFKVFRKTSGSWAFLTEMGIVSGTTGSMAYVDTGAPTDTLEYRIEACHATNCSMDSNIASVTAGSSATTYQCSDGKDNDGDGWIDYPGDSGCTSVEDNDETYIAPPITPPGTSSSCSGSSASCTTSTACAGAGYYWCTPTGQPAGCSSSPCPSTTGGTCSSTPSYCTTQAQCASYNFFWCSNGTCASNSSMCGGGSGGGTASSMQRCFYPNATISGSSPGYTVWCESDYYNCHQGSATGAPVGASGLSLGAPSSCESGWTTGGGSSCSSMPSMCTSLSQCQTYNFYWCSSSNSCVSNSSMCSGSGGSSTMTCNGNNVCESNESYSSCPSDCGGSSSTGTTCNNDGTCNSNESYTSCPSDCGGGSGSYSCSSSMPGYCYSESSCTGAGNKWCVSGSSCHSQSYSCP